MKSDIINIYDYPEVGIAMRRNIIFVGEENKINNELYQLLNWRFEVTRLMGDPDTFGEPDMVEVSLVVVSMVGKTVDYTAPYSNENLSGIRNISFLFYILFLFIMAKRHCVII